MTVAGYIFIIVAVQLRKYTMKTTTQKLTTALKLRIRKLFSQVHGLTFTATIKQIKKVYPKFDARYKVHWYTLLEYLMVDYDKQQEPNLNTSEGLVNLVRNMYSDIHINYYPDDTFLGYYHRVFKHYTNRYGNLDSKGVGSIGYSYLQKKYVFQFRTTSKYFDNIFDAVAYIGKSKLYQSIQDFSDYEVA